MRRPRTSRKHGCRRVLPLRSRRWSHPAIDSRVRIAVRYLKGLTLRRRRRHGHAAASPGSSCGAVTCAERFVATAQQPPGRRTSSAIDASRCALYAARRCRFASQPPFRYLCGQEGDAERAQGSRTGRLAHTPRRLKPVRGWGHQKSEAECCAQGHAHFLRKGFLTPERTKGAGCACAPLSALTGT